MRSLRVLSFAIVSLSFSPNGYSQEDETVKVEAPRVELAPLGVVFGTVGGQGPKCADPTCGGLIDPKEPGEVSNFLTTAQKTKKNKENKDKAKAEAESAEAVKKTTDIIASLKKWLKGSLSIHADDVDITINADGSKKISGKCVDVGIGLGSDEKKSPCTEIKGGNNLIKFPDGHIENQLILNYTIKKDCYWTNACKAVSFSFIAGSEQELLNILNDVIGETYFFPG